MKKIITIISVLLISVMFLYPLKVYAADSGVTLDGYFDDWIDKPSQKLYYWQGAVHTVKWYSDDKDLYLYIKMATVGGQQLNNYTITYSDNNGIQGNLTIQVDRPSKGRISIYNYSMDYRPFSTDGYVVRGSNSDGKTSDQGEFRIPLTIFQKDSKDQMITLNLGFPNLGNQGVAFQVGSTYPYMGVSIGILIVASGFFIYRRKRKIE
ncbi:MULTISPECIES: Firmicu-CTERM sorting domain-containing protein [Clostridium]|uniref:Firmicu-CTERM sorting domain-containing protein n=2 Tax=Clostridium TaxID=1485 RepID=D8GLT4_CLOLD|nr:MULTISPECIES: Firmicu-CTERM sorting domain-containing protein [Clostridium]ADK13480.1 hypothetical protein CLJU_c03980 [Clostridium ljungdahlii DSM 13528]OAA89099.1 hypothetical protein WX45_02340 [Clostridium ljungdahlii DSM 13528]OAA94279.1 hypothetical protein WX73_03379 [Clostridium coskatii]OBR95665.1 hypothetical protein CLCOS_14580 [Clostridium coskatii]